MKRVYLTRLYRFNAGHRLYRPDRDADWNWNVFGKCSYESGHGHNYELEVVVTGEVDSETGRLVEVDKLDLIVEERVLEPIDHRNLNEVLELTDGPTPTTEVLILEIWRRLVDSLPHGVELSKIRVRETEKNLFELGR